MAERFFLFLQFRRVESFEEVDPKLMLEYQIYVSRMRNKFGNKYDTASQNLHIRVLRVMFGWLIQCGEMTTNHAEEIVLAKEARKLPKDILSVEEIGRFLDALPTETPADLRDKSLLELLYGTGLRRSEVIGVKVDDVNVEDKSIFLENCKGGKDRVVPVSGQALHWLEEYLNEGRRWMTGYKGSDAVYLSRKGGGGLTGQGLGGIIRRRASAMGLESRITPHSFRHSCATHLLNAGASIAHIQRLFGSRVD